jgi:hypothetical protein
VSSIRDIFLCLQENMRNTSAFCRLIVAQTLPQQLDFRHPICRRKNLPASPFSLLPRTALASSGGGVQLMQLDVTRVHLPPLAIHANPLLARFDADILRYGSAADV